MIQSYWCEVIIGLLVELFCSLPFPLNHIIFPLFSLFLFFLLYISFFFVDCSYRGNLFISFQHHLAEYINCNIKTHRINFSPLYSGNANKCVCVWGGVGETCLVDIEEKLTFLLSSFIFHSYFFFSTSCFWPGNKRAIFFHCHTLILISNHFVIRFFTLSRKDDALQTRCAWWWWCRQGKRERERTTHTHNINFC